MDRLPEADEIVIVALVSTGLAGLGIMFAWAGLSAQVAMAAATFSYAGFIWFMSASSAAVDRLYHNISRMPRLDIGVPPVA